MYDVIIVGAGIAGLGAARVLTREGYHVIVLEARNRPGGRIHSIQLPPLESPYPDTPYPDPSNHDNLSVFHASKSTLAQFIQDTNNPSESTDSTHTAAMDSSVSTSGTASPCTPTTLPGLEPGDTIDVDLGANYLIGCSNRQADQPLFHMARLLGVPTATSAGDLCKKYRGWECAELASWRNHLIPGAPSISIEEVAEGVFLFDKVIHLAVHNHLKLKSKLSKARKQFVFSNLEAVPVLNEPTVKQFIDGALDAILKSEARFGIRPQAAFRSATEEGIFNSVITRYLAYVNPLERLPHTVLDELCEVANPRWHLNMNDTQVAKMFSVPSGLDPSTRFSLADQLALAYPSTEQREAYQLWAERKLSALALDQAGACSAVVRSVHVSWEDRLVTGRFSDLIQPLMHNVPIVYNTTVTLVNWLSDAESRVGVRVHIRPSQSADMSSSTTVYEGKHCIITVPVGVLKGLDSRSAIAFQPPLPRSKQEAIERLAFSMKGAATHDKVILRFRSPEDLFWDTKAAHLKCPDPRLHILNLHRYGKPGVLCAHLWGGSGLTPYGMSDQEVVNIILDLLDRMHPEIRGSTDVRKRGIPDPVQYVVTRWSEDPYALGAYTTGEPGSSDADRLDYAMTLTDQDAYELTCMNSTSSNDVGEHVSTKSKTPTPRLLFAGEGTLSASEAKECTHGALQTGVRCALELLPFLSNSSAIHASADQHTITHSHSVIPMNKLAHYLVGKSTSKGRSRYRVEPSDRRTRSVRRPTKHIMDEVLDFAPGRRSGGESYSVRRSHSASDTSMVMATSESSMSSSDYDECHTTDTDAGTSFLNGRHTGSELRVFTHRRPGRGGFVNVCRANDVTSTVRGVPELKTRGSGCGRNKAKPSRTRRSDGNSKCLPTGHNKPSFTTVNNRCRPTRPLTHIRKIREAWPSLSARGRAQTLSRLSELLDELRSETGPHHVGSQNMHKSPFSLSPLANCTVQLRYTSRHSTKLE